MLPALQTDTSLLKLFNLYCDHLYTRTYEGRITAHYNIQLEVTVLIGLQLKDPEVNYSG